MSNSQHDRILNLRMKLSVGGAETLATCVDKQCLLHTGVSVILKHPHIKAVCCFLQILWEFFDGVKAPEWSIKTHDRHRESRKTLAEIFKRKHLLGTHQEWKNSSRVEFRQEMQGNLQLVVVWVILIQKNNFSARKQEQFFHVTQSVGVTFERKVVPVHSGSYVLKIPWNGWNPTLFFTIFVVDLRG